MDSGGGHWIPIILNIIIILNQGRRRMNELREYTKPRVVIGVDRYTYYEYMLCRWIDPPPNERALSCPSVPVSLCSLDNSVWSLSNETDQYNPIISVRIKRFWQTLHFAQHTLSSSSAGHGVAHIPRTWPVVVVLSSALVHFPCSHSLTFFVHTFLWNPFMTKIALP